MTKLYINCILLFDRYFKLSWLNIYIGCDNILDVINSMKIKEIPNMGKIIFDKFYNSEHIGYFVDLLHISDKIVFSIAEGSSVAPFDFQEALVSLHKNVRVITNSTKNMELLLSLKETDTLITLSMTGNYALATLNEIEKSKANKVLITLNHSTIFNEVYDKVIHFSDNNSSRDYIQDGVRNAYTIYGFSYLFDLILNRYFEKYNN